MAEIRTMKDTFTAAGVPAWGGPISETETALGGQSFEGYIGPNDRTPDQQNRVPCPNPPAAPSTAQALDGMPICTLAGGVKDEYFGSRSKHAGGVNVSYCDGPEHFVADSIDLKVWRSFCSSEGGESNADFQ